MRVRPSVLSTFALLPSVVTLVDAQSNNFSWSFGQNVGTSLPECGTLPITITSKGATRATYYMIALAMNGVPTTSLVGNAGTGLSWVVNQPAGTSLVLYLVDGSGNSGVIPPTPYTVTGGQSSECLPSTSTSSLTITANATVQIATCDLWQVVARGGTQPYTVLLASPGSSLVTNVTLPVGSDMYTYVNRAAPNGILLAAVRDSKGAWAKGTPYVITTGSSDTTCGGLTSFDGVALPDTTSTTSGSDTSTGIPNSKGNSSHNKTSIIAGVCAAVGCLFILAGALLFLLRRRKRNASAQKEYLEPHQFQETTSQVLAAPPSVSTSNPRSGSTKQGSSGPSTRHAPVIVPSVPSSYEPPSTPPAPLATSTAISTTPTAPGGRNTKAQEASTTAMPASPTPAPPTVAPLLPTTPSESPPWPPGIDQTSPEPDELVFQHTDARAVTVRELPPPYGSQVTGPAPAGQTLT